MVGEGSRHVRVTLKEVLTKEVISTRIRKNLLKIGYDFMQVVLNILVPIKIVKFHWDEL